MFSFLLFAYLLKWNTLNLLDQLPIHFLSPRTWFCWSVKGERNVLVVPMSNVAKNVRLFLYHWNIPQSINCKFTYDNAKLYSLRSYCFSCAWSAKNARLQDQNVTRAVMSVYDQISLNLFLIRIIREIDTFCTSVVYLFLFFAPSSRFFFFFAKLTIDYLWLKN